MKFCISHRYGFFEVQLTGTFDAAVFHHLFEALFAHEKWERDSMILYDVSELTVSHMPIDEVSCFIKECEQWRESVGRGKCAFVTPEEDQHSFACMFKRRALFKWDVEMEVFRERSKAISWMLDDPSTNHMYLLESENDGHAAGADVSDASEPLQAEARDEPLSSGRDRLAPQHGSKTPVLEKMIHPLTDMLSSKRNGVKAIDDASADPAV
jgi:hypothetical protein